MFSENSLQTKIFKDLFRNHIQKIKGVKFTFFLGQQVFNNGLKNIRNFKFYFIPLFLNL